MEAPNLSQQNPHSLNFLAFALARERRGRLLWRMEEKAVVASHTPASPPQL